MDIKEKELEGVGWTDLSEHGGSELRNRNDCLD
jgi:hypothetical protein